jgi:hypothetical protein
MNTRKTLIMAVILLVAVVYLTQVTLPSREVEVANRRVFSSLKGGDLVKVDITRRLDGDKVERFSLNRISDTPPGAMSPDKKSPQTEDVDGSNSADDGIGSAEVDFGRWDLTAVRGAVLDGDAVKGFFKGVRDLELQGPLDETTLNKDISVYGLDRPALTIELNGEKGAGVGGAASEVAFGKLNLYSSKRYVKVSGRSGIYLVPDGVFEGLNKAKNDFRSKNPVQFDAANIREALITSSLGRIKISQPAVGEWKITEPVLAEGSATDINELLNALKGLRVAEFIDVGEEGFGKYGFSSPRVNIHLQLREGMQPPQMAFSLAKGGASIEGADVLYLQASGVDSLYKLSNDPSDSLVKSLTALRERRILKLEPGAIKSVGSTAGKGVVATTIEAQDLLWKVNGKESDPMFVEQYLRDLGSLKAVAFPTEVPNGVFDDPFLALNISLKDPESKPIILTVGGEVPVAAPEAAMSSASDRSDAKEGDLQRYVKSSNSDQVYIIRDLEAKRIVPHEEALLPKATPTAAATVTAVNEKR